MTDVAEAPPLTVHRWRKWGKDRAYVRASETELGYRDLKTGVVHCSRLQDGEVIVKATAELQCKVRTDANGKYSARHRGTG